MSTFVGVRGRASPQARSLGTDRSSIARFFLGSDLFDHLRERFRGASAALEPERLQISAEAVRQLLSFTHDREVATECAC